MKKYKKIIITILLLVLFILVYNDIISIPCIFHKLTGLYCPGCGATRMVKSILRLDFYQAFRYNQLLFIYTPFIIVLFINYIYCIFKKKNNILNKIPNYVWWILVVITVLYGILRNIFPVLGPLDL